MIRRLAALMLALGLGLAASAALAAAPGSTRLDPAALAALRARQPARAAIARGALLDGRAALGLGADAGFEARRTFTDLEGRTVVRFRQTHRGHRVWGGEAIVHVERDGAVRTLGSGVKAGVEPAGEPRLTADQAIAAALARLAPKGRLARPATAELVVFPTRFTGDVVTSRDPATGRLVIDRERSVRAPRPRAAGVWAWEVSTLLANRQDGLKELRYVVDAETGAILRIESGLRSATAATGQGHGWYAGDVALSTTLDDDGRFTLVSPAHGTLPNPFAYEQGVEWVGLTTTYSWINVDTFDLEIDPYPAKAENVWGDGTVMLYPPGDFGAALDTSEDGKRAWIQGALTPRGETAAVDAHTGLSRTWDFYQAVYGRDGIDGEGTSTFAVVHALVNGGFPLTDNAFWSDAMFAMFFGDGTAGTAAAWPNSMVAVTELDITAHELTHGVTATTAGLVYAGESGALNEATSDILGKMVEAWAAGGAAGTAVPDFPAGSLAPWSIGRRSVPDGQRPLRLLYKPSLDGVSADAWFGGLDLLDVHFSSGIANRFFYFLAAGASSDPAADTHSPYLPAGLAGIGNEKAAAIWYRALTEYFLPDTDYAAAREATVHAAADLHGAGSAEVLAVERAWAAVNVGSAPGEAPRARVTLPVTHPAGTFLYDNAVPEAVLERVQIFPTRARVTIRATVENAADPRVRIEAPTDSMMGWEAGRVNEDGSWTTPWFPYYADLIDVVARSEADPLQFARGRLLLMELDGDTDGTADVFDLAATAMEWGLPQVLHQPVATGGGGNVDDWDLVFWTEAFQNGYRAR